MNLWVGYKRFSLEKVARIRLMMGEWRTSHSQSLFMRFQKYRFFAALYNLSRPQKSKRECNSCSLDYRSK